MSSSSRSSSSSSRSSSSSSRSSSSSSSAIPPTLGPNTLFDFPSNTGGSINSRMRINSGYFGAPTTTIQFTLAGVGYPGGVNTTIQYVTSMYVGEAYEPSVSNDTAVDYASAPTEVTFDGTSGVILMPQTAYVSDVISYSHDPTKDLMISMHFTTTGLSNTTETFTIVPFHGTGRQFKFAPDETSVIDVNTYSSILARLTNIIKIEMA